MGSACVSRMPDPATSPVLVSASVYVTVAPGSSRLGAALALKLTTGHGAPGAAAAGNEADVAATIAARSVRQRMRINDPWLSFPNK